MFIGLLLVVLKYMIRMMPRLSNMVNFAEDRKVKTRVGLGGNT